MPSRRRLVSLVSLPPPHTPEGAATPLSARGRLDPSPRAALRTAARPCGRLVSGPPGLSPERKTHLVLRPLANAQLSSGPVPGGESLEARMAPEIGKSHGKRMDPGTGTSQALGGGLGRV